MAVGLRRKNYETQVCHFIMDDEAEVALLPDLSSAGKADPLKRIYACAMGSIAKITGEDSVYYILTGENEWVKKTVSGGGGSGGSSEEDYDFADESDIDNLFKEI